MKTILTVILLAMASSAMAEECTEYQTSETGVISFSCTFADPVETLDYNFIVKPQGTTKEEFANAVLGLTPAATELERVNILTGRNCFTIEALNNMIVCP